VEASRTELDDLDYHWGAVYRISCAAGIFTATRKGDAAHTLVASSAEDMRSQLRHDHFACYAALNGERMST
jgi:hypothetical protein